MILRPKARDQFYSWYVNSKHEWSCLYNFSPITFAQISSLTNHLLPNVRDAVEAAANLAREGFTEASKSRKNQDDIGEEKRVNNCNKEKQSNHDKGKTIRKRRRGLQQGYEKWYRRGNNMRRRRSWEGEETRISASTIATRRIKVISKMRRWYAQGEYDQDK